MLKIGLTGGIACGKSYALRRFRGLGAHTIDADQIAREVVAPGRPALEEVRAAFGDGILTLEGALNRSKLGEIVFSDATERERLNAILHPYILEEEERRMKAIVGTRPRCPLVMVDAALMVEVGSYTRYDLLLVVYCPPEVQLGRLRLRDGLSQEAARRRIDSQMPAIDKARLADYVIETSGTMTDTDDQIRQIFVELLQRYEERGFSPG